MQHRPLHTPPCMRGHAGKGLPPAQQSLVRLAAALSCRGLAGAWLRQAQVDPPEHSPRAKIVVVTLFGHSLPIPAQPATWGGLLLLSNTEEPTLPPPCGAGSAEATATW